LLDELELELDELEPVLDELELDELEAVLELDELELLDCDDELELGGLLEEVSGAVGLPPHPLSGAIPRRAAPPERRIRNSRRSDRRASLSCVVLPGAVLLAIGSILPARRRSPTDKVADTTRARNRANDPAARNAEAHSAR